MNDPYFGGPRPLAARERLVTPKDTPPAKAPPPQRGPKGPTVTAFKGNPAKPIRRSAPAFKGEQPAGYTPTPQYGKFGQIGFNKPFNQQKPYYQVKPDTRSGIEQAVDRQVTPLLAKGNKVASSKLTTPLTVAGNVLAQASGGPVALDALNAARKGNVGAAAVDVAGLLPVGRLGRLVKGAEAGLRAAQEEPAIVRAARAVGKVKPAEAKALQVVHEGVPIEQRIAEAKAAGDKVELKALQAASKHVNDVNGMPRVNPANHRLVETYAKAERKLKASQVSAEIQGGMKEAKSVRKKQNIGYSEQRSKNVAAGQQALDSGYGMASFHAALAEHRGPLPKIEFSGFGHLTPENLDTAAETIKSSNLTHYQQINVAQALEKAVHEGAVPTPYELNLIQHVFGKDLTGALSSPEKLGAFAKATEVLNIPRTIMSSFDLSAPFRQGLIMMGRHPITSLKNFGPMVKAFGSEKTYRQGMQEIVSRPNFPLYQEMKLALTDFEHGLAGTEEPFIGKNYAEKIPIIGHPIRGSGRAYTLYLNKTRADIADQLLRYAKDSGINIERQVEPLRVAGKQVAPQPKPFLKSLGEYINAGTGRGTYQSQKLEQALPLLNSLMFSPRLLASRLNFLNPVWYARLDPFVRKQALRAAFQTLGAGMTVLGLAHEAGLKVGIDPTSADFGKIRVGNTRIDIWGGFQQPIRLLAQIYAGHVTSSTTGKVLNLGPSGPAKLSRGDIALRFGVSKLGPVPSAIWDISHGQNQIGQKLDWSLRHGNKFNWNSPYASRMIPLLVQDARDLYNDRHQGMNGIDAAMAGYGIGLFGIGLQTYGQKQPKPSGGSSPFSGPGLLGNGGSGGFSGGGLLSSGG